MAPVQLVEMVLLMGYVQKMGLSTAVVEKLNVVRSPTGNTIELKKKLLSKIP